MAKNITLCSSIAPELPLRADEALLRALRDELEERLANAAALFPANGAANGMSQAAWLRARLAELPPRVEFAPGSEISLGGVNHVLRWDRGAPARLDRAGGRPLP